MSGCRRHLKQRPYRNIRIFLTLQHLLNECFLQHKLVYHKWCFIFNLRPETFDIYVAAPQGTPSGQGTCRSYYITGSGFTQPKNLNQPHYKGEIFSNSISKSRRSPRRVSNPDRMPQSPRDGQLSCHPGTVSHGMPFFH